ncbi:DNA topoisomerase [Fusobacterium gonidiaformans 3-1-5R]|uniref:DNA topoisomerase n=1 Tax=Fusobacterium gonidiaformans 3-1-5R TaxID=469605 RepID=E5BFL1_9FUSO|nr:DNA topoisomerase [Fusobacterium gonidiaformans]EFS20892.1 DNA topoisomerase [Fusobacterium gonidiaformans 3-1-5R]
MKVIIAEKPKLGRTIAHALRCHEKKEGYIEGENYIVTWGFGHLFTLKDIGDYEGLKGIPWDKISLPFCPTVFELKFTPDKEGQQGEVQKQFNIIKELVHREDVVEVINCGDADREGQVIVDEILQQAKNKKPVTRLWLPEQTEETIRQQISVCASNTDYMNLYHEGLARSYIDWLLGINLSVYLTIKANSEKTIRVGRVLIPIIKYICDRDRMISNFIPETYFQIEGKGEKENVPISLLAKKRYITKEEASAVCQEWNSLKAKVVSITKKEIKKYPKNLFSLSKLQEELSSRHKMDFTTSLKLIQKLYEEGYVTYPRTNTQFLAENEKEKIKEIISKINETGYELEMKDSKSIFDSSKVESHSALTPTLKLPEKLSSQEEIVYRVIFNRFVSNFLKEDTVVSETTLIIQVGEQEFKLKGTEIVSPGFYQYEPKSFKNQLPNLIEGEEFIVEFLPVEKVTTPPKKVSETELSNFLENPFKKRNLLEEEDEEDEEILSDEDYKMLLEGIEIGTVATRTPIIQKAQEYEYITLKNSQYSITPFGEKVIQLLDDLQINLYKEKNIEFSQKLKKVYHGMLSVEDTVSETWGTLQEIIRKDLTSSIVFTEEVGICPKCGKQVLDKSKFYGCIDCDFKLWKQSKYFKNTFPISTEQAKKFLNHETVDCEILTEEKKKEKKQLKMVIRDPYVNFEEEKEIIGICPKCGKEVLEGNKNFYCSAYKDGCNFVLWKESKHFKDTLKITKAVAKKLLKKDGKSSFEITRKDGKRKKVDLKIKLNGDYVNFEEVK